MRPGGSVAVPTCAPQSLSVLRSSGSAGGDARSVSTSCMLAGWQDLGLVRTKLIFVPLSHVRSAHSEPLLFPCASM